ncbi:MAG: response regulator transcription factor, partial [Anaerolineae bacterium]|nr:response regulator transcription factor [Anaerolineae bacterium]
GREALTHLQSETPDLIILDWMMPEIDGIEVLRRLRAAEDEIPVLVLTARDAIEDRVIGLDGGADDYLVKPFATAELLARLRSLMRRFEKTSKDKPLEYAGLYLDTVTRETRRDQRKFDLTPKEFELLYFFLRHPRQVLTRDQLLEEIWGYDFGGDDNVLEVYVGYLRKKTEAGSEPRLIQTIRGVGYVLREE